MNKKKSITPTLDKFLKDIPKEKQAIITFVLGIIAIKHTLKWFKKYE